MSPREFSATIEAFEGGGAVRMLPWVDANLGEVKALLAAQGAVLQRNYADSDNDDQVARIYVYFERSEDEMTLKERARFKLGRARKGKQQLSAALCYVWDNRHPVGSIFDSAETPFVAVVVAANGDAPLGKWISLQRDVTEDYHRAFNAAPTRITGIAVSVDTDDTGESATTWFGDIDFVAAPKR